MPMSPRLLRPRANRVSTPLPLTIAGLETWFDAADTGSVTLDSGRVSEWRDKSGKGRHAVNSTSGTTQPSYTANSLNGLHRVVFASASQQFLVAGSVGDWNFLHDGTFVTGYVVSPVPTSQCVLGTGGGSEASTIRGFTFDGASLSRARVAISNGSAFVIARNLASNAFSGNVVFQFRINPSAAQASRLVLSVNKDTQDGGVENGVAAASPSSSNSNAALNIGRYPTAAGYYAGGIGEVLLYARDLSSAERLAIRNYLYAKWGLTGT